MRKLFVSGLLASALIALINRPASANIFVDIIKDTLRDHYKCQVDRECSGFSALQGRIMSNRLSFNLDKTYCSQQGVLGVADWPKSGVVFNHPKETYAIVATNNSETRRVANAYCKTGDYVSNAMGVTHKSFKLPLVDSKEHNIVIAYIYGKDNALEFVRYIRSEVGIQFAIAPVEWLQKDGLSTIKVPGYDPKAATPTDSWGRW